jgi:hypothetical protein
MYQALPPSRSALTVGNKAYMRLHKGYHSPGISKQLPRREALIRFCADPGSKMS